MSDLFTYRAGSTPLLINIPHAGTRMPEEVAQRFDETGSALPDTDWHVDRLFEFAAAAGASLLVAAMSRYVVDLDRDPTSGTRQAEGEESPVVPVRTLDGKEIYRQQGRPDAREVAARIDAYWWPYHRQLEAILAELRQRHGFAVLLNAHSVRTMSAALFEDRLPDLNLGTVRGRSCDRGLAGRLSTILEGAAGYSTVRDGRFIGGYCTRHYGQPTLGLHALHLGLAQHTYMEERPPHRFRPDIAGRLQLVLRQLVDALIAWSPDAAARSA